MIEVTGLTDDEIMAMLTPEMREEGDRTMAHLREIMASLIEDTGQSTYSSMLATCPFCGGRAYIQYWDYPSGGGMEARVVCSGCHVSTSRVYQSGSTTYLLTGEDINKPLVIEKALASWNRRSGIESSGREGADMVATNDERRRVASALREKPSEGSPYSIYESVCYALGKTENEGNWDVIARLADLIEPDGHFADTGEKVDREALLALADEMDRHADMAAGHVAYAARFNFAGWAVTIREALGDR